MILAEITVIAFSASGFAGQIGDRAVLLIYLKAIFFLEYFLFPLAC